MTGGIPNVTKSGLSLEIAENKHQHPKIHHLAHRDPPFSTFITETLRIVNSHWNPKTVTCVPLKSMRSAGPVLSRDVACNAQEPFIRDGIPGEIPDVTADVEILEEVAHKVHLEAWNR